MPSGKNAILCIAGARPNFMKVAPVIAALRAEGLDAPLVHTGQHYDQAMSDGFFADLNIPKPEVNLEVGSGSHAQQTAEVMRRFEPVLQERAPKAILVVGDVNSTLACALVAVKMGVPILHVEAGLRSADRAMPEEINRILTDQISDLLFTTERAAEANLAREGISKGRVRFVGNVMIDTLRASLPRATPAARWLDKAGPNFSQSGLFGLLTLHRPSNVDDPIVLRRLLETLRAVARDCPLLFPAHPRTRERIRSFGLDSLLADGRIHCLEPLGYLDMLGLMSAARVVLTDSGGIQEETTALGVPCLTLRENTERPITVEEGSNTVVGTDPARILRAFTDILASGGKAGRIPELWDGHAAPRIAQEIRAWLAA